ncbi:MAG: molybdopterin-dependent oxidoreductase [Coriobacteriales bacterium]|nr:molybdopterin-dependent oxidoreductase [Coriobacteriales bacterium]
MKENKKGALRWALDNDITRRSFIALAAASGVALTAASTSWPQALADVASPPSGSLPDGSGLQRIRSVCRGCGKCECGCWVTVDNGRAIKVEGDESSVGSYGNCCAKSQASLQACYHPDRLRYPLKRTKPKGENDPGWVRISWDEALSTAAAKVAEINEQHGFDSLFAMNGTARNWCMASNMAMSGILNTVNVHKAGQICKEPRMQASFMQSFMGFWMEVTGRPRVWVQWGTAQEMSNYDDSCRTAVDTGMKADHYIIVDPRLTNLGKEADIWLPLRPGTDGAMALGWLNVIINKGLYSETWAKRWTDLPFLVLPEDESATKGWENPTMRDTHDPGFITTKLLKESDLREDGSPSKLMVWDNIGNKLAWYDRNTTYWENESPLTITSGHDLPGKDGNQPNLPPGIVQGYVPDLSDFSRCDPLIDPALEGEYEVTLKSGRTVKCKPAWDYLVRHVSAYDPQTVAEICEVPAEDIIEAATLYATPIDPSTGYGNGHINFQLAVEHSCNSVQCCRILDTICGLTNNLDVPGGGRGGGVGLFGNAGMFGMFGGPGIADGNRYLDTLGGSDIPYMKNAGNRSDGTAIWDACNRDVRAPYPLYGGWSGSGDFMSNSNPVWAFEGLKQLDFFVVLDLWHTPQSQLADLLLPARHWLEIDCTRTSQAPHVGAQEGATCKCVEPLADTWFDPDIVTQFCKHLNVPWNPFGQTDDEKWPSSLQQLDDCARNYEIRGYLDGYEGDGPWEKFKSLYQEQGFLNMKLVIPEGVGTYRRYEFGVWGTEPAPATPAMTGFSGTPSRRHEIWSTLAETTHSVERPFSESGTRDIPYFSRPDELNGEWLTREIGPFTLPTYTEPPEGPRVQPERAREYPFICTTGRRIPVYFHNEHRQLPWCRENWPVPRVEINPADAEELGIRQGDWVWIETERHKIRQCADLYYGIKRGVINLEHSWWMPEFKGVTKGFELVGCNTLINKDLRDPLIGSNHLRAYNVKIYKATAENSPFNNPVPCDFDGTEMITSASDPRLKEWLPVYDNEESRANYAERNKVQL